MSRPLIVIFCMAALLSGCTHALEVKNRDNFSVTSPAPGRGEMALGVITDNDAENGKRLVDATVEALRYRTKSIIYPYSGTNEKIDLTVTMKVESRHKGSGLNFWINWPGFLIWTPAWHGYNYEPTYDVRITFTDPVKKTVIDSFNVPIQLDVRHADINRTWTEISWFEVSLIALVGGVVFTEYDPKVTPLVEREMRQELGAYLAEKILLQLAQQKAVPPS